MTYHLLDHFWHTAHAHRLQAIPADVMVRDYIWHDGWPQWVARSRPFPPNKIIDHYEAGVYDAVILHVDEACWRYQTYAPQFRELREQVREPVIVINHGTPEDDTDVYMMRDWLDGCHMVVNSRQAARDWGWGTPIIHGYDAREWPLALHGKPEIMTAVGGWRGPHHEYNGCDLLEELRQEYPLTWLGFDERPASFDEYVHLLRRCTIYLNPTRRSPMPGARTEAMLTGRCVVTLDNHDASDYIRDGETGLLAGDERELRDKLRWAWTHPREAARIGFAGAHTARATFTVERLAAQWAALLDGILGKGDAVPVAVPTPEPVLPAEWHHTEAI